MVRRRAQPPHASNWKGVLVLTVLDDLSWEATNMTPYQCRIDDLKTAIGIHLTFRDPNHPTIQRLRQQIRLERTIHRAPLVTCGRAPR